jgi:hypothetical protein
MLNHLNACTPIFRCQSPYDLQRRGFLTVDNANFETLILQDRSLLDVKLEMCGERIRSVRGGLFAAVAYPVELLLHRLGVSS